jgi:O-antigen ligase
MLALVTLVATSMLGFRNWRTLDWVGILVLVLPVLVLKTRGPVLWTALTLAIVYVLCRSRAGDRALQAGLTVCLGLGAYVLYHSSFMKTLIAYMTRDNVELSMSLTGRAPLWDALLPMIQQRTLLGWGFAAFWNPENFSLMERLVGFPVVSAHNGFLEELLNNGAIGLALFLTFWVSTMAFMASRGRRGDPLGWMAFLFMLFYLLLNLTTSLMQESFEIAFMVVFVTLGLMAVRSEREEPALPPGRWATDGGRTATRAEEVTISLRGDRS